MKRSFIMLAMTLSLIGLLCAFAFAQEEEAPKLLTGRVGVASVVSAPSGAETSALWTIGVEYCLAKQETGVTSISIDLASGTEKCTDKVSRAIRFTPILLSYTFLPKVEEYEEEVTKKPVWGISLGITSINAPTKSRYPTASELTWGIFGGIEVAPNVPAGIAYLKSASVGAIALNVGMRF